MLWMILVVMVGLLLFGFLGGLDGGLVNLVLVGGLLAIVTRYVIRRRRSVAAKRLFP